MNFLGLPFFQATGAVFFDGVDTPSGQVKECPAQRVTSLINVRVYKPEPYCWVRIGLPYVGRKYNLRLRQEI